MQKLDAILLIDDDHTSNFLNERLLNRLQIARKIQIENIGEEAIFYLKRHCQSTNSKGYNNPDLIFLACD